MCPARKRFVVRQEFIALVLGTIGVLVLLDLLAWRIVRHLAIAASNWAPRIRNWPAWARARPVRAWIRLRFPRLYAFLAARLNPGHFTGLPLTLFVLSAAYIAFLLSGLVEEVLEADNVLRFDESVNAFFRPWRTNPLLVEAFLWITTLGSAPALTVVAATATGFLWTGRRRGAIVPLWIVFFGAQASTWAG
jgi:undecaprenyl-diphosphatase